MAAQIAREIAVQPDADRTEYGAMIFIDDDGRVRRTALTKGSDQNISGIDTTGIPGPEYGRVVGTIHNHPYMHPTNNGWQPDGPIMRAQNRFPSKNILGPSGSSTIYSDVYAYQEMVAGGADANVFRGYIADDEMALRSYPYQERNTQALGAEVSKNTPICGDHQ